MKLYLLFIFIVGVTVSCAPMQVAPTLSLEKKLFQSKNWTVAVLDLDYEFEEEGTISISKYKSAGKDGGRVVAGILAAELGQLENMSIIERQRIAKVIEEQALHQTGLIDSQSAMEIGKLVGADGVVMGELTDYVAWENVGGYGSTISFSMRMTDVQTGKVIINAAISRVHVGVEPFSAVQLTTKELIENIKSR